MKTEEGNIVQLKSGGPLMTVDRVENLELHGEEFNAIVCVWFNKFSNLCTDSFDVGLVKHDKEIILLPVKDNYDYLLGKKVTLQSDESVIMSVENVCNGRVYCVWFNQHNNLCRHAFNTSSIKEKK